MVGGVQDRPQESTARTVTNDVPQALLDLAKQAFELGLGTVRLGFMHMGDDFVSPIEWALWLGKRDDRYADETELTGLVATMFRGDDAPRSYKGYGNPYWGVDEITAWMHRGLPASGEFLEAWAPVQAGPARDRLMLDWDLFEAGVLSGWIMERRVLWGGQTSMRRMADRLEGLGNAERAAEVRAGLTGLTVQTALSWENSNGYYNVKKHPAYRGKDSESCPVSVGGRTLREGGLTAWRTTEGPRYQQEITELRLEEILGATAPWFVRVADPGDRDADDGWKHFPEAEAWKESPESMAAAVADTERAIAMSRSDQYKAAAEKTD